MDVIRRGAPPRTLSCLRDDSWNVEHQILPNHFPGWNVHGNRASFEAAGKHAGDRVRTGRHVDVQQLPRTERHCYWR